MKCFLRVAVRSLPALVFLLLIDSYGEGFLLSEVAAREFQTTLGVAQTKVSDKKDLVLISDLSLENPAIVNLHALYPDRILLTRPEQSGAEGIPREGIAAVIVLLSNGGTLDLRTSARLKKFVAEGGKVFMDLRAYGWWRGLKVERAAGVESIRTGISVLKKTEVTRGFRPGQICPWFGDDGSHFTLAALAPRMRIEILGVSTWNGKPALVQERVDKGCVVAVDMLSLDEPMYRNVGAFNKYLFLGNLIGHSARYGEYYPRKLNYYDFVQMLRETSKQFSNIRLVNEGRASGGYAIYSLNIGDLRKPLFFIYAMAHGSEWEPGYGLVTLSKLLASKMGTGLLDLGNFAMKIIPCLNPSGYDFRRRQNANGVDLNRNVSLFWHDFHGSDTNKDGHYGSGDFDWKGPRPFSEPETQIFKKICDDHEIHCLVDFHGNANARYNKMIILPVTGAKSNLQKAGKFTEHLNVLLKDRYIFKQNAEKRCSQYLLRGPFVAGRVPFLMNYAAKGRYGFLMETSAGYPESYATVMQTDVVVETCLATLRLYGVK